MNLLIALDSLLRIRNVSLTADHLGLSQPAMSGYLARLREYFGDELLCSAGKGRQMTLTHRAQSLVEPVCQSLLQIRATITRSDVFHPSSSERHFKIVASHYAIQARLSKVLRHVALVAPRITFTIQDITAYQIQQLNTGEIDLLITLQEFTSPEHPSRVFLTDDVVVLAWNGAPARGGALDEDQFFSRGHVVVQFSSVQQPAYEEWLVRAASRSRRKEAFVPSFSDIPFFLLETDRLGVIQGELGRRFSDTMPVVVYPMPFSLPPLKLAVQWHTLNSNDAGLRWLVDMLTECE